MRYLKVKIWNTELGRLTHNPKSGLCIFTFNPELKGLRPDVAPILLPLKFWDKHQFAYGDSRKLYQGLPPFIADSLPDSWGNELFDQWVKKTRYPEETLHLCINSCLLETEEWVLLNLSLLQKI